MLYQHVSIAQRDLEHLDPPPRLLIVRYPDRIDVRSVDKNPGHSSLRRLSGVLRVPLVCDGPDVIFRIVSSVLLPILGGVSLGCTIGLFRHQLDDRWELLSTLVLFILLHVIAQWVYLGLVTTLGIVGLMISYIPIFASAKCIWVRTGFFIAFGLSAFAPFIHMVAELELWYVFLLGWKEAIMGGLYIGGAVIYASKIPERWFPGKLDCSLLSSHPLWHIIVVLAGWVQMYASFWSYQYRMENPCT